MCLRLQLRQPAVTKSRNAVTADYTLASLAA